VALLKWRHFFMSVRTFNFARSSDTNIWRTSLTRQFAALSSNGFFFLAIKSNWLRLCSQLNQSAESRSLIHETWPKFHLLRYLWYAIFHYHRSIFGLRASIFHEIDLDQSSITDKSINLSLRVSLSIISRMGKYFFINLQDWTVSDRMNSWQETNDNIYVEL